MARKLEKVIVHAKARAINDIFRRFFRKIVLRIFLIKLFSSIMRFFLNTTKEI
ncbi:hypothetical protein GCM10023261_11880 [Bartonella jaculi]|uniref:Uncharacterized protein n=1 Tax=Bartonella jaculi TaxID=686226 RepID=A0ABP9NAC7_9HYPH